MIDSIEWLRAFIVHYPTLQYIIIFLGAAFGGEVVIIFLSFLAAQNFFPFYSFLFISFIAVVFSDIFWFLLGRTKMVIKVMDHRYANNTILIITQAVHKVSRGNNVVALVFVKFLVGIRVMLLFSFSKTNMTISDFVRYNFWAIFIWLAVIIPIGFLSGLGFTYISDILENIYVGIGFLALVLFIIMMIQAWFKRVIARQGREILEKNNML